METGVLVWWVILCVVTALNIFAWIFSAVLLTRIKTTLSNTEYRLKQWLLWLSGIYVLGCGFRSVLPRVDVQRICLVDSWLSNIMIGRSIATIAELCFVIQWMLLLRIAGRDLGSDLSVKLSLLLVPIIFVAEIFSWYAVLTTNFIGHVVEESLWTLAAILLLVSFVSLLPRVNENMKLLVMTIIGTTAAYVVFMSAFDVPMYLSRWQTDTALQQQYLSLSQGLHDLSTH